jgi:hypothetical protein
MILDHDEVEGKRSSDGGNHFFHHGSDRGSSLSARGSDRGRSAPIRIGRRMARNRTDLDAVFLQLIQKGLNGEFPNCSGTVCKLRGEIPRCPRKTVSNDGRATRKVLENTSVRLDVR